MRTSNARESPHSHVPISRNESNVNETLRCPYGNATKLNGMVWRNALFSFRCTEMGYNTIQYNLSTGPRWAGPGCNPLGARCAPNPRPHCGGRLVTCSSACARRNPRLRDLVAVCHTHLSHLKWTEHVRLHMHAFPISRLISAQYTANTVYDPTQEWNTRITIFYKRNTIQRETTAKDPVKQS